MTMNDLGHIHNLSESQHDNLRAYWIALLSAIDTDSSRVIESPMGDELFYLFGRENPDVVLLRWLRARKWNVPSAVQFMLDTLQWRREWGLRPLIAKGESDLIQAECASGKIYTMGKDRAGRSVTYVHTSEHIKGQYPLEASEKLLIFWIETAKFLAEPPFEEGTIVIDLLNVSFRNLDYQHIKFMINVMQNCYPECLGVGLIVNAPWSFGAVWNIIKLWLDPIVARKIHFLTNSEDLTEFIDPAVLPERLGGHQLDFRFQPPTDEDEARVAMFRQDTEGMQKAQMKHRQAAQHYIDVTLKWASTQLQTHEHDKLSRVDAAERLHDAFKELLPYISTQTHLHRIGDIREPIFDITFDRLCRQDSSLNDD